MNLKKEDVGKLFRLNKNKSKRDMSILEIYSMLHLIDGVCYALSIDEKKDLENEIFFCLNTEEKHEDILYYKMFNKGQIYYIVNFLVKKM